MVEGSTRPEGRDGLYDEVRAVLESSAARLGLPVHDARLLRLHSNAIFALPSASLVVRIATNPAALSRVEASITITRWLASRGFPCVSPADIAGPFTSVSSAIQETPHAMPEADRTWLTDRIAQLRDWWPAAGFPLPPGLIHGDAHAGNLMRAASGQIILGDWDHVTTGPREWDLVQIHYMRRRFGRATEDDIAAFTTAYGWDIRSWPGLDTLIAVREITGLSPYIRNAPAKPFSSEQLAYRLQTLQEGDTTAPWQSPPAE